MNWRLRSLRGMEKAFWFEKHLVYGDVVSTPSSLAQIGDLSGTLIWRFSPFSTNDWATSFCHTTCWKQTVERPTRAQETGLLTGHKDQTHETSKSPSGTGSSTASLQPLVWLIRVTFTPTPSNADIFQRVLYLDTHILRCPGRLVYMTSPFPLLESGVFPLCVITAVTP